MAKIIKKWHIASVIAIIAIIALIVVLVTRKRENMTPCPPIPPGDALTSFTQNASNCTVTCQTTDSNATVAREPGGGCRSICKPGYVKSATTGACTVSAQMSSAVIDNMKLQLMNLTDPAMKQQMAAQIASMEAQLSPQKSSMPQAR
jgi:hypothetical protein